MAVANTRFETRPNPALRSEGLSPLCYGREYITVSHQPFIQ